LVVLVKHSEVRKKNEALPECAYAHAFEAQAVAETAPSFLNGGVGGQKTRDKAFCTRMTTEHPCGNKEGASKYPVATLTIQ